MKRSYALLGALALLAACSEDSRTPVAPVESAPRAAAATGKYIVVLKEGARQGPAFARLRVDGVADEADVQPERVYTHVLNGFAAELTEAQLNVLRRNPNVAYIEPDAEVKLFTTQANPISWGLDRIDQLDLPLNAAFTYTATGAGVNAYILDTGINLNHLDYVGRAAYIPNGSNGDFVGDGHGSAADCQGHGSHVAGTVGGTYSGVAKGVTILMGRVVNCSGGGTTSMVIAGMDWIRANGQRPAVVNMSLGYGNVQSVADAATNLVAAGYVVAVAAGNGNFLGVPINACNEAPAKAPNVLTVGSTTSTDAESSFSNFGTCVDILAPGSAIYSSDYLVTNQVVTKSGTSMASPHVAGVAAQYLSLNPTATPAQVTTAIKSAAVTGTINLHQKSRKGNTPNLFLRTIW
ncbi:MAG TPA: S8 family peptidase [Longimicrobiaceae bacterium]|nr:S8 family peptidase [Longimicrobiaceae bacterium]